MLRGMDSMLASIRADVVRCSLGVVGCELSWAVWEWRLVDAAASRVAQYWRSSLYDLGDTSTL